MEYSSLFGSISTFSFAKYRLPTITMYMWQDTQFVQGMKPSLYTRSAGQSAREDIINVEVDLHEIDASELHTDIFKLQFFKPDNTMSANILCISL